MRFYGRTYGSAPLGSEIRRTASKPLFRAGDKKPTLALSAGNIAMTPKPFKAKALPSFTGSASSILYNLSRMNSNMMSCSSLLQKLPSWGAPSTQMARASTPFSRSTLYILVIWS